MARMRYLTGRALRDFMVSSRPYTGAQRAVPPDIGEDAARRVVTGCAGHAAPGVSAGAAQVQAVERRRIARMGRHGAHEEELIWPQVTVKDVALGDAGHILQIGRRVE